MTNKMFGLVKDTTNVGHQILQRETNLNGGCKKFAAELFRERFRLAKNLYKTDLRGHFGCVNAIEFSHGGTFLASGGDDKRVLVWNVEKSLAGISTPRALATEQASNIFCLGFDSKNRKLISGGNDTLAICHDFETGKLDNVFKHDGPVYGLSIDPQNDHLFSTASENGEILLFDQRSTIPTVIASVPSSFHAVEFHPTLSNLLVTANSKRGATLYDLRFPKQPVILYDNFGNPRSCMSVRFNRTGKLILGLRRRLPPILYNVSSPDPIGTFYHSNYYNSCTMKSCTFAGEDDELVISGSDDFNLYVWRLSEIDLEGTEQWVESTQMVLYGHRSIVNQVRYNREKCLLASSGVEKIIKIWSPFGQENWSGSLTEEASCSDNPRELYSPYNLFTMALPENWHHLSHDYSSENTNEDPRMMAFFDSLIQQEIEEWETNSSSDVSEQGDRSISSFFSCADSSTSTSSSSSSSSSDSDSINENASSAKRRRRSKRQAMMRKKAQRKQHNKKTKLAKIKANQMQKPINRIAYLIAKKRNTLRRLAIKGSSSNNRRSNKLAVVVNVRNRRRNAKQTHRQRSARSQNVRKRHVTTNNINNEKPTTSAAAAKIPQIRPEGHATKKTPKTESDPNGSSEGDSGNFVITDSSRSSSSSISNNVNIPSTSTGITSNFRDAFLRLSRQIFMSDSDDDHREDNSTKLNSNLNSKIDGVSQQPSNSKNNITPVKGSRASLSRSACSNQRPRNSAAVNVINNEMILPQRSHPINAINNNNDNDGNGKGDDHSNKKIRNGSSSSKMNGCNRAESTTSVFDEISSTGKTKNKKRLNVEIDKLDDLPTTSRNSTNNSSSSLSAVSSISSLDHQEFQTPLKRRKMHISDYIKTSRGTDCNEANFSEQGELECNSNETNGDDMFAIDEENMNNHIQVTPQKPIINSDSKNLENFEFAVSSSQCSNNSHFFTPDSGISLNNSLTPSTIDQNDIETTTTSTTRTRNITPCLSPSHECNSYDAIKIANNEIDEDSEGVSVRNSRKTNLTQFQQRVARVRRNYRKQFVDDTESD